MLIGDGRPPVPVAKHPDSRECLILLGEILETPHLAERLLQVLRPEKKESGDAAVPYLLITDKNLPGALQQLREGTALVGFRQSGQQRGIVDPLHARNHLHPRADDLMTLPLDLVHHDRDRDVEPARRRARGGQLAGEGHRDAAAVRGREQLLGAGLAARVSDPRGKGEGQPRERAALGVERARAAGEVPVPADVRGAFDVRHQPAAGTTAAEPSG